METPRGLSWWATSCVSLSSRLLHVFEAHRRIWEYQDNQGKDLVKVTTEALEAGISVCGPGKPFRAIGKVRGHYQGPSLPRLTSLFSIRLFRISHCKEGTLSHHNSRDMVSGVCFTARHGFSMTVRLLTLTPAHFFPVQLLECV